MDHFRPGGAVAITASTVEISVSCRNLVDMDVFSKSDPMCILFVKEFGGREWIEFGRTEIIWNNLNPEWAKKFLMNFFFEERQHLKFEVFDIDSESHDLSQHDFLGRFECTLGEIVSGGKFERPLQGGPSHNTGYITVAAEDVSVCKEEITFRFEGKNLDKKDWFGKSDPYLTFYRANEDRSFTVAHRTEYIKNNLNPIWKEFTIPSRTFCGGDYNRTIVVKCFDWNKSGKEDLIGEFTTNLQDMVQVRNGQSITYDLINPKIKAKKKTYANSGRVILTYIRVDKLFTFVDFVSAGTQLNCTIAIDFTASNGAPTQPSSLHYFHPNLPNHYQRALTAVGEIIQDYDSDKLFPVLGFGARLPPDGRVSHEFFVNGQTNNPYCEGIAGVMNAYQNCLMSVQFYGPTNFAPCINHVARFASMKRDGSEYFILLIITDGIITDMPQTKEAIVNASSLPLSIIIVGVGTADFTDMNELDGDEIRLSSNGRFAERDIVQFVPFRNFVRSDNAVDVQHSQERLAREVLAEIPDQFLSYMKKCRITPGSWKHSPNKTVANQLYSTAPSAASNIQQGWTADASSYKNQAPPPYPGGPI